MGACVIVCCVVSAITVATCTSISPLLPNSTKTLLHLWYLSVMQSWMIEVYLTSGVRSRTLTTYLLIRCSAMQVDAWMIEGMHMMIGLFSSSGGRLQLSVEYDAVALVTMCQWMRRLAFCTSPCVEAGDVFALTWGCVFTDLGYSSAEPMHSQRSTAKWTSALDICWNVVFCIFIFTRWYCSMCTSVTQLNSKLGPSVCGWVPCLFMLFSWIAGYYGVGMSERSEVVGWLGGCSFQWCRLVLILVYLDLCS